MWRKIRILILLLILLFVALNTYFDRVYSTDWDIPLRVTVFPINADGSATSERFVQSLSPADLLALESFFQSEAAEYGIRMERPVRFTLALPMRELPPTVEPGAGRLSIALWSLRTRYWAWRTPVHPAGAKPDIELFVLYHDPALSPQLPHSVGLQKGLFGIVHAFADRRMMGSNDTVMAHEFLHTLGATDKYDLATNEPLLPIGYAEPERQPLYPQEFAEVMGGRIPVSPSRSEMPESLRQVIVGPATATEIGWKK
ncbi:MAG TPA: hypothetical protein VFS24_12630 [Steroidobacteraceae bacterium]|nr:hypothetical protein [Steroidobacteraceae bacterium]